MKRVLFLADSHFSETSRFEECIRLHNHIAKEAASIGVDLIAHGGDLLDHKSSILERQAVADWLRQVSETAPVVIARGNHSVSGDLALFSKLRTKHPIVVEEAPQEGLALRATEHGGRDPVAIAIWVAQVEGLGGCEKGEGAFQWVGDGGRPPQQQSQSRAKG